MGITANDQQTGLAFLQGGGEMGALTRAKDWSRTPFGDPVNWPQSLKTTLSILLNSRFPMFLWWGPDLTCFYNDAYRPSLGNKGRHPGILGLPAAAAWPEIWEVIKPLIDQVLEGGESIWREDQLIPIYRNDSLENVYWTFSYSPVKDETGKIAGVFVTCSETTGKVAISESETRLKYLLEDAPVAIGVLRGRELMIESANKKTLEIWGKTSDVIGKPLHIALPELQGQTFLKWLDDVYTTGIPFEGSEVRALLEHEGMIDEIYLNFVYQPIQDAHGHTHSIMLVAVDVTDQVRAKQQLKESKEHLQLLADNISQLTWMADENGYVFWYNQRWYDYTGSNFEEMQGWGWKKVQDPEQVDRVVQNWTSCLQSGIIWEDTFPLLGKDGNYRWFLTRAVPLKDDTGKIIRWFGTNTDITKQRKLAEQKDDFISIASHELKTPVTSLKASLQLLDRMKDDPSSPLFAKLIGLSNRSMEKITELIEDLLDASRLNESQLHIIKFPFVLSEMLAGCCSHVRSAGKHELVFLGDAALQVTADEHRIDQVVVNFVNNAVKYAPDSKNIYLIVEKQAGFAKITVKDNGPGIAPDKIPHLFSKYYRAEYAGNQYSGLGLGLYISAEIIKRHGGEVGVNSELGIGSSFWFTLPL